jgi:hypothetical protein
MKHLADFFASLEWWKLRPVQGILTSQPGKDDPARFVSAARTEKGDLTVIYLPVGGEVTVKAEVLGDNVSGQWFDPRTGERQKAESKAATFQAPDDRDWVLLLKRG